MWRRITFSGGETVRKVEIGAVGRLVRAVDVLSQRVRIVDLLVADCTGVVVKRQVLGDCSGRFELRIAAGTCVCHSICIYQLDHIRDERIHLYS